MFADHTRAMTRNLNKFRSRKSEAASPNRRLHVGEGVPEERYYLCANRELDVGRTTVIHPSSMPTTPMNLGAQAAQRTS
jgi:hypothetical protein